MRGVELVVEQEPRLILTLERFVQQITGLFTKHGIEASFTDGNEKDCALISLEVDLLDQLRAERREKGDYSEYNAYIAEEGQRVQKRVNAINTLKGFGDLKLISKLDFGVFYIIEPKTRSIIIYGGPNWDGVMTYGKIGNGRSISRRVMRDFVASQDEVIGFLEKLSTRQPHQTLYNEGRRYFIPINIPHSLQETIYDRRAPCLVA